MFNRLKENGVTHYNSRTNPSLPQSCGTKIDSSTQKRQIFNFDRHSCQRKLRRRSKTSRRKSKQKSKTIKKKKEAVKRRILEDSSSSDNGSVTYQESSDSPEEFDEHQDNPQDVSNGDYVIVKVYGESI